MSKVDDLGGTLEVFHLIARPALVLSRSYLCLLRLRLAHIGASHPLRPRLVQLDYSCLLWSRSAYIGALHPLQLRSVQLDFLCLQESLSWYLSYVSAEPHVYWRMTHTKVFYDQNTYTSAVTMPHHHGMGQPVYSPNITPLRSWVRLQPGLILGAFVWLGYIFWSLF